MRANALLVAASVAAAALAACGGGGRPVVARALPTPSTSPPSTSPSSTSPSSTSPSSTSPTTTGAPSVTKDVLAATGPSIAYVETPTASGSAVLIDGGYLVTNGHVVDPFGAATVTFPGGERHDDVPIAGSDVFADIAVLGPIATQRPALHLAEHPQIEQGDDLYLVGYPGGDNADSPKVTISRGILSRTRTVEEFGQTYFQTDAAIAGGQSGGALVNDRAEVVGISGLTFAEKFALALSSDDVRSAIAGIQTHTALSYRPLPDDPGVTTGTVHLAPGPGDTNLLIPPVDTARTVDLVLADSANLLIDAETLYGDLLLINQAALDAANAQAVAIDPSAAPYDLTPDEPVGPDTWRFDLPAGEWGYVRLGTGADTATDTAFTASTPIVVLTDADGEQPIMLGDRVEGVMDSLEWVDTYLLDLASGQSVTITATSPQGDAIFAVVAPGQPEAAAEYTDDSNLGLYGMDAERILHAVTAGTYRIEVSVNDGVATGYALAITPA